MVQTHITAILSWVSCVGASVSRSSPVYLFYFCGVAAICFHLIALFLIITYKNNCLILSLKLPPDNQTRLSVDRNKLYYIFTQILCFSITLNWVGIKPALQNVRSNLCFPNKCRQYKQNTNLNIAQVPQRVHNRPKIAFWLTTSWLLFFTWSRKSCYNSIRWLPASPLGPYIFGLTLQGYAPSLPFFAFAFVWESKMYLHVNWDFSLITNQSLSFLPSKEPQARKVGTCVCMRWSVVHKEVIPLNATTVNRE